MSVVFDLLTAHPGVRGVVGGTDPLPLRHHRRSERLASGRWGLGAENDAGWNAVRRRERLFHVV